MTIAMSRVAVVAAVMLGGFQAPQSPPAIGDLASVVTVMKNPAATAAQRDALVGRVYAGVITVDAIRLEPPDQSVAIIVGAFGGEAGTDRASSVIGLRFAASVDDEKVRQLRRGQSVRVRGRLKDFSLGSPASYANFTDLVIEGPVR